MSTTYQKPQHVQCALMIVLFAAALLQPDHFLRGNEPTTNHFEDRVTRFCGACHPSPSPGSFPKLAWHEEVEKGYRFYFESGRTDLDVPPMAEVVAYFRKSAPDSIALDRPTYAAHKLPLKFAVTSVPIGTETELPSIAHVRQATLAGTSGLLYCDMRLGQVGGWFTPSKSQRTQVLAQLKNPCHVEPVDLDQNGIVDLLVADLGSFNPADHDRGRIIWLRQKAAGQPWESVVLADKLGRVADVRAADFDGDKDLDLVCAEFGWHRTGRVSIFRNLELTETSQKFEQVVVDSRPGAIHVPVVDLNQDGHLDFVVLLSQEYESVLAYLNQGNGSFARETIFAAKEPSFGSSGIELVDFDKDGDTDVLYTNGDTFDSMYLNPHHGIQWLENTGSYPFTAHPIVKMPGVFRALPGDFDGDGDLDLVAVSNLPRQVFGATSDRKLDSILFLERQSDGTFANHPLEQGSAHHASVEVSDFDGDGDLDFAVGSFRQTGIDNRPLLRIWWNQRVVGP